MEKLTKREALEKMRDMWLWIARETEERKCFIDKKVYFYETEKQKDEIPKKWLLCLRICVFGML